MDEEIGYTESLSGYSRTDECPALERGPITIQHDFTSKPELKEKWDRISFKIMDFISYYLTDERARDCNYDKILELLKGGSK